MEQNVRLTRDKLLTAPSLGELPEPWKRPNVEVRKRGPNRNEHVVLKLDKQERENRAIGWTARKVKERMSSC